MARSAGLILPPVGRRDHVQYIFEGVAAAQLRQATESSGLERGGDADNSLIF